jgi:hypothetical protein
MGPGKVGVEDERCVEEAVRRDGRPKIFLSIGRVQNRTTSSSTVKLPFSDQY